MTTLNHYGSNLAKELQTDLNGPNGASIVGYLPAGPSAVTTSVQDKLRESVSVLDFGAVCDGVTDDTAAIIAAELYARTTKKKLTGQGVCLISSVIEMKAWHIDLSTLTFKIADNFPGDVAILYKPETSDLKQDAWVSISFDGNRANQTQDVIAIRVRDCATGQSTFNISGRNCNTILNVIGNTERGTFNVFGQDSNLMVVDGGTGEYSPDTNNFYLSGGHNKQFYIKNSSTTSTVFFNVQGQDPYDDYPVKILSGRRTTLAGEIRATYFGAIYINQIDTEKNIVDFDNLSIQGGYGVVGGYTNVTPAVMVDNYEVLTGTLTVAYYPGTSFYAKTLQTANLNMTLLDCDTRAEYPHNIVLGDFANGKAAQGKFTVVNRGLVGGSNLVLFDHIGAVDFEVVGSAQPITIGNNVNSRVLSLSVPSNYITQNAAINCTASKIVDCKIRGTFLSTEILAYSYKMRGMNCWNVNSNSMAFFNGTAWFAPAVVAVV